MKGDVLECGEWNVCAFECELIKMAHVIDLYIIAIKVQVDSVISPDRHDYVDIIYV